MQAILRRGALTQVQLDAGVELVPLLQAALDQPQLASGPDQVMLEQHCSVEQRHERLGFRLNVMRLQEASRSAAHAARTLVAHSALLNEEYAITISADGRLIAVPNLLDGILPDLLRLPAFALQLSDALLTEKTLQLTNIARVRACIVCTWYVVLVY